MAQIRKTITVSQPVYLDWHCSKCGSENHNVQNVQASVTTGNLWDKETPTNAALEDLGGVLEALASPVPETRFRDAKFSCKCEKCGHREPWASLNTDNLKAYNSILYSLTFFSFIGMMAEYKWCIVALVLFALAAVSLSIYTPMRTKKMLRLLDALPEDSLPTVTIRSGGKVRYLTPPPKNSDNTWVCCQCGTVNTASDKLCRRCETAKDGSDPHEKLIWQDPLPQMPPVSEEEKATVAEKVVPPARLEGNKWICPKCSKKNDLVLIRCPKCATKRILPGDPPAANKVPASTPKEASQPVQQGSKQILHLPPDQLRELEQKLKALTTRWVCPKCGLVNSKDLQNCCHCGTPQTSAKKFIQ